MIGDYEPVRHTDERIIENCKVTAEHRDFGGVVTYLRSFYRPQLNKKISVCRTKNGTLFTVDSRNIRFLEPPKR